MIKRILSTFILSTAIAFTYAQNSATEGKEFYVNFTANNANNAGSSGLVTQIRYVVSDTCYITAQYGDGTYLDNNVLYYPGTYTNNVDQNKCYTNASAGTTSNNKYIKVTSTKKIGLYALNMYLNTTDGTTILPVEALGNHYTIISNAVVTNPASISIIAPTAGTIITIKNASGTALVSNAAISTGLVYIYTYSSIDITGYTVESNNNISAFVSVSCGREQPGGGCDYNWEQLYPTNTAGKHYIVWSMSFPSSASNNLQGTDYIRVVALENGTNITQKIGSATTNIPLNKNQVNSFNTPSGVTYPQYVNNSGGIIELTSDKPFIVGQILGHAPSIKWISPIEQRVTKAFISPFVPAGNSNITSHRLHIIIPASSENSMLIKETRAGVDVNVTLPFYTNTTDANYKIAYKEYTANDSVLIYLNNPGGFIAYMVGYGGSAESYVISAGAGALDLSAYFTVDGTHHQVIDSTTICGAGVHEFEATLWGAANTQGYLKWYVNGVEEVSARDSMKWNKNLAVGNYTVRMDVIDLDAVLHQYSTYFTVENAPVITTHPATAAVSKNVNTGNFTSLNVVASGANLSYQWYSNATASNSGGTLISGATSTSYSPPSNLPIGDYYYYCIASNNCGSDTSNVSGKHSITIQDIYMACPKDSLTFTAHPTNGGASPTYQWKKNGAIIAGATNLTYTYIPANGDTITCEMTSNENCAYPVVVASGVIVMLHSATVMTFGASNICIGTTTQLTATRPGTWQAVNPSVATVTNSGLITGVGIGSARFVFTDSVTACIDTTIALTVGNFPTVNPITAAKNNICINEIIQLSSSTLGGIWTLSNNSKAQIVGSNTDNPVTIRGLLEGQVYVTYTVGTAPCQSSVTFSLKVLPTTQPELKIGFEQ